MLEIISLLMYEWLVVQCFIGC